MLRAAVLLIGTIGAHATPQARQQPGLEMTGSEVVSKAESLAFLDSPSRFELATTLYFVDMSTVGSDPQLSASFQALRGCAVDAAPSLSEVWAVLESRAPRGKSPEEIQRRRTRVASTPSIRIESQFEPVMDGTMGRFRKDALDLYWIAHPGAKLHPETFAHQLYAQLPSTSPPLDDPDWILRPLPIALDQRRGVETCVWRRLEAPGVERLLIEPRLPEGGRRVFDFDERDGLPRRCLTVFSELPLENALADTVALFEFGPTGREDWLHRAIHLSFDPDTVSIELIELANVSFDVPTSDLHLVVPTNCILFDYRSGVEVYHGLDKSLWPADIQLALGIEPIEFASMIADPWMRSADPNATIRARFVPIAIAMAVVALASWILFRTRRRRRTA